MCWIYCNACCKRASPLSHLYKPYTTKDIPCYLCWFNIVCRHSTSTYGTFIIAGASGASLFLFFFFLFPYRTSSFSLFPSPLPFLLLLFVLQNLFVISSSLSVQSDISLSSLFPKDRMRRSTTIEQRESTFRIVRQSTYVLFCMSYTSAADPS